MQHCESCGTDNPPAAKFCGGCGNVLAPSCPSCGAAGRPSDRFCLECGSSLAGTGDGEGPSAPGAPLSTAERPSSAVSERRVCSVLFADLVEFTPFSESRDPEEVRELLSRYFDVARRTITRYGGTVEKFIGDAVMAVWGTPVAQEGDTERAVRAALDLVEGVRVLGEEAGAPGLGARAGVVTGEVAVTLGATNEGMVAGDAVNTASRVQSVARPGAVFVDGATRRLSAPAISFHDEGTFELKGKVEPQQLFAATRVVSSVGGRQWAEGLEAPFTGRDAELRTLKDLFHTCIERRTPRLVVITGPAGVGKSRLGWEFEKYIDGLVDTMLWHRGRCLSYGEGVAFWALAEIVRQRFGIAEEDPLAAAASKLAEGMVRYVAEGERDYVGVRISRLLGVPYGEEPKVVLSQDELYAGWRLFFEQLAGVAPAILLVEDAQHADASLLGFFEHLVDWTRDLPIFVLLFARPGHGAIDAGYGVGRNRSTLSLDPLDTTSMSDLVDALVPGMPPGARDAINDRAQGIPLFAVETVRSLIDQGAVQKDADAYRLVGDIGTLRVPDSLHALLAARLDALPKDARALVADASVLGTTFPKEAIVAVSNVDLDLVDAALAELVRRDVLQVVADPLSPERGAYRFSQEMLRQVAYETLSKRDRRAIHLAVAAHLRSAFPGDGEEIADAIARHYLDALAAGSPDAATDDIRADALAFLVRAAERSTRSGAVHRAAELYAEAAGIAPNERAPSLFEEAARASDDAGDFDASLANAEAAVAAHLDLGDTRGVARARTAEGHALMRLGRHAAAQVVFEEALSVLRERPDLDTVRALRRFSGLCVFSGNMEEGRRLATEALDLAQALGVDDRELAGLFNARGLLASSSDRLAEAASDYRECARLAERAGDFGILGLAQVNLADVLVRSDVRAATDAARSAVAHSRRNGRRAVLAVAVGNLATALAELGDWQEASAVLGDALEVDLLDSPFVRTVAGWLAGLRGDAEAAAAAQASLAPHRSSEDPQDQAGFGLADAATALCAGDVAGALAHAMAVVGKADAIGIGADTTRWAWPLAARAARSLDDRPAVERLVGELEGHPYGHLPPILRAELQLETALLACGEGSVNQDGLAAVEAAVEALRDVGNPYQLAHALVDLADVRARAGGDGVDAALAEASTIAERLGCPPLAVRASAVGSRYARADASN
ncbi:MAG TPA: adenylate/guanylate cyclase domain-containing protein [Acidimicrobiales bacterium]|nr:adenylate/guanylate cyclase domain-containing protein [Acidimicrobiales bacterium]